VSQDVGELAELRRELRRNRMYLDDAKLRAEVSDWIQESVDQSDADTARQYVEERLNSLLDEYPMYNAPSVARGADGFPDGCEGCVHYGSACPVVTDRRETRWRERKLKDAASEQEARRVFQQQARDVDCQRIPEFLAEWDTDHRDLLERGQDLQSRVEDELHGRAEDSETALADGGDQS
jgi:hypothetical protein